MEKGAPIWMADDRKEWMLRAVLSRIRTKLGVSSEDWKEKDSKRKRNEDLVKNRKKEDARKSEEDGASDFLLDSVWYFNAHFGRLICQLEKVPFPN